MQQPHAVRAHIRILWCGCAVAQGIAVCPSPARTRRAMTSATACAPICYTVGGKTVGMVRGNGGDSAMAVAVRYCGACGAGNNLRDAVCIRCKRPLPAVAADHPTGNMPPNMVLAHRYIIISQAGRGGMGAVYKARDQQAGGRIVAIKELSQSGLTPQEQAEAIQTFQHEADLLAGLRHAGLPRFYNRFSEGGRWYLVMDYIEGETLEEKLRKSGGRPLPVDQVIQVGIQLCAVLTYLHTRRPPIHFRPRTRDQSVRRGCGAGGVASPVIPALSRDPPSLQRQRRKPEIFSEVTPSGILLMNQFILPRARPAFDPLLSLDCRFHRLVTLEPYEPPDAVTACEASNEALPVLPNAHRQVGRDSSI